MSFLDLTDTKEATGFDAIPADTYLVSAYDVSTRESKAGHEYLNIQFKIMEGPYENRRLFEIFNVNHPKDEVKEIALSKLKGFMTAAGFKTFKLNGPEDLQGKTAYANVTLKDGENKISHFRTEASSVKPKSQKVANVAKDESDPLPF